jgi:hypothetical protein
MRLALPVLRATGRAAAQMELNQLQNVILDLRERSDALRGYL